MFQVEKRTDRWRSPYDSRNRGENEKIDECLRKPCRSFLFYTAAILDISLCDLDFTETATLHNDAYLHVVSRAVVREVLKLDDELKLMSENLEVIFEMLQEEVMKELPKFGRREASEAFYFWKRQNPRPFNTAANVFLYSQAS